MITQDYIKQNQKKLTRVDQKALVGEKYWYLTFISMGYYKGTHGWFLKCDCGKYTFSRKPAHVTSGKKKTCGCSMYKDRIGYIKWMQQYKSKLNKFGILYVSQDQWKRGILTYWCPVHKDYKVINKSAFYSAENAPCFKCGKLVAAKKRFKTTEQFIKDSKSLWGDGKFDYSLTDYKGSHEKVTLICDKGTEFIQTATDHLSSIVGCPCCNGGRSGFNKKIGGYFYLFLWTHSLDGRQFLKYGITNKGDVISRAHKQKHRRAGILFDYSYLDQLYFKDGYTCAAFEQEIMKRVGKNYINKEEFPDGFSETTSVDNKDVILNLITEKRKQLQ